MARNSEKAMLLLNRWQEMKTAITRGVPRRRPRSAESVDSFRDAEYWRNNIVREISVKIAEVQNAALGEARLRELNDEINKHLREKAKWEEQIVSLGGPDYRIGNMFDAAAITTRDGYKYFGATKELKSVRELLINQKVAAKVAKPTRAELSSRVDPAYYGFEDEVANPDMVEAEQIQEKKIIAL